MNEKVIMPGSVIGILGGGQLGRMIALEAKKMGYDVVCLDPTPNSPCGQVADEQIVAPLDDINAAIQLAEKSDVIIYEFENIDVEVVQRLEGKYYLPQRSHILKIAQDRLEEKISLKKAGFPTVPYEIVRNPEDFKKAIKIIGYPALLKTVRGGYDGKGQFLLTKDLDAKNILDIIEKGENTWVLEKKIDFCREVSAIVARKANGETAVYPVAENIHQQNILHTTIVPARISALQEKQAQDLAVKVAEHFKVVGLLTVEYFDTDQGLLINELAPRPHNSGHYTLDACYVSQFEQLIRTVCGLPLGLTELLTPVTMINILGADLPAIINNIQSFPSNVKLHLYGKGGNLEAKRKMGHITIKTNEPDKAIAWSKELYH